MARKNKAARPRTRNRTSASEQTGCTAADDLVIKFAHELRTPLSATLLWTRLLQGPGSSDPALLREGLGAIDASAKEQQNMIDQLVEVAHLLADRVELHPTPVALLPFVRRLMAPLQTEARSRNIVLHVSVDPAAGTVQADAQRLQQVLHIILTHALRFTPAGGRVNLELICKGGFAEWRVTDTGAGIGTRSLSHLFELCPMEIPPGNRAPAGLGVSLYIARRLVELHRGSLTAESEGPGHGTTFTVRLPRKAPTASRPHIKTAV